MIRMSEAGPDAAGPLQKNPVAEQREGLAAAPLSQHGNRRFPLRDTWLGRRALFGGCVRAPGEPALALPRSRPLALDRRQSLLRHGASTTGCEARRVAGWKP